MNLKPLKIYIKLEKSNTNLGYLLVFMQINMY